jgi:hypothetical protein
MIIARAWLALFIFFSVFSALPRGLEAAKKTLKRTEDPVIIEGKDLMSLLGSRPDRLSLMAWTYDGFQPVPFQMDERDEKGEYVFTMSVEGGKTTPSNEADQDPKLDANDELVFMVFDAGDRHPEVSFPDGVDKGVEIEITDPVDGGKAWIYLFAFKNEAPRSGLDYVRGAAVRAGLRQVNYRRREKCAADRGQELHQRVCTKRVVLQSYFHSSCGRDKISRPG